VYLPMADYPKTLVELEGQFGTEQACREYLFALRWPEGFVCPKCRSKAKAWPTARGLWLCGSCRHQASVTAGTIFQDTRLPLTLWFRAIWFVTSQKNGVSALGVQRVLGLGSYQTAWAWLHKLRRAMVRPGREKLKGLVEVDETYLGGLEEGCDGRGTEDKTLVVVAVEAIENGIGRIRLRQVPDASRDSLQGFVEQAVEPDSTVRTDGWPGYVGLERRNYHHAVRVIGKGNRRRASHILPRVHRVISLLKRWLMGTHQGAVSHAHLDYYLDEFVFRFNRRTSASRGKLFYRLIQQAVQVEPAPYRKLVHPQRVGDG
jgi:transposase-like protein/ribosomal protein L37AE/L43A